MGANTKTLQEDQPASSLKCQNMLRFLLVVTLAVMASGRPQEDDGANLPVPKPFQALRDLCGNNVTPAKCTCADGSFFPNPTECRCPGKQWQTLTIFGCENGGMPGCPNQADKAPWDVYKCSDGTAIDFEAVKASKITGKCACQNGGKPVCAATNASPKCPDGKDADPKVGYIASFIKNCL